MSSILKTDTINEKTTNNGLSLNGAKMKGGLYIASNSVGTGTIGATESALLVGTVTVTGTVTVNGELVVI